MLIRVLFTPPSGFWRHPQTHQLLNLLLILLLGKLSAHLRLSWNEVFLLMTWSLLWETLLAYGLRGSRRRGSVSALSTAVGVMLMLAAPSLWILALAIVLGLLQKHLIRPGGHHLFNPSNFAVVVTMILFYSQAHIVLGQLGDREWLALLVLLLGAWILIRVDRWLIPLVFVGSYLLLEYLWVIRPDPVFVMEELWYRFYSVSFLVYILFMLTDPRTTPRSRWLQALFGLGVALAAAGLDALYAPRAQHLFVALFLLSPLAGALERWREGNRRAFWAALGLFFLAIGVIIYLQSLPPYHFEMAR